jgi:predicted SAM-dependent methyltransferase
MENEGEAARSSPAVGVKRAILAVATRFAPLEVLQQVRWELRLRARAVLARLSPRQRRLLARLRRERPTDLKVNLGCGPLPAAGWLNIDGAAKADLVQHLGRPLALPDGCARLAFSEHVLEHLDYPASARLFLREAFRILRPGGTFRVVVPDAGKAMRAYVDDDRQLLRRMFTDECSSIEAVNRIFREFGFHRWAWDYDLLARELGRAGFGSVRQASFRDSRFDELNIDFDEPERIAQSLYVEATRLA